MNNVTFCKFSWPEGKKSSSQTACWPFAFFVMAYQFENISCWKLLNSASYCCSVRPKVYVRLCVGKNIGNFYQVSHPNDHLRDPQLQRIAKPHKPLPIYTGVNCRNIIANWLVFHLFWLYYITEKLATQICMHCSLILTVLIDTCLHQNHPLIMTPSFTLLTAIAVSTTVASQVTLHSCHLM